MPMIYNGKNEMSNCKWKAGDVVTVKNGKRAWIYWVGEYMIHGAVESRFSTTVERTVVVWDMDGLPIWIQFSGIIDSDLSLVPPKPQEQEVWVVIYKKEDGSLVSSGSYNSPGDIYIAKNPECVGINKITIRAEYGCVPKK